MITIDLLKNHPEAIPHLASIWCDVIGKIWAPEVSLQQIIEKFQGHLNDEALPLTFVAFNENTPIGMSSLRENDGSRTDFRPWLGSLVVDAKHQKKGIGKKSWSMLQRERLKGWDSISFTFLHLILLSLIIMLVWAGKESVQVSLKTMK